MRAERFQIRCLVEVNVFHDVDVTKDQVARLVPRLLLPTGLKLESPPQVRRVAATAPSGSSRSTTFEVTVTGSCREDGCDELPELITEAQLRVPFEGDMRVVRLLEITRDRTPAISGHTNADLDA